MPRAGEPYGPEDVPFWEMLAGADLAQQLSASGPINKVAGFVQPVAVVGDSRGESDVNAEVFTASATVAAAAGDAGLFEFHHPQEPAAALIELTSILFQLAGFGGVSNAVQQLISSLTQSGAGVSKVVVILDVAISMVSVTNSLGPWGGVMGLAPLSFTLAAPAIIDVLPTLIAPWSSFSGTGLVYPKVRGRLWAGRRNDGSGLPAQNNAGAVFGMPGAMCLLPTNVNGNPWRPFERCTPFVLMPARGFAIGFGTFGVGQQSNVNAACSVTWKEIAIG